MTSQLRAETLSFAELVPEWWELLPHSSANTVFATPDWQEVWWRHFGGGLQPELVTVRDGVTLLGVAPLARRGAALTLLGGTEVSDYLDIIARQGSEPEVIGAVLDYAAEAGAESLELHCVPEHSPTRSVLDTLAAERGWRTHWRQEDVCPRIELPATWDDFLAGLSKKDRHELRRKMRRLFGSGDVDYYALARPDEVREALGGFLELHRKSREDKARFMTEEMAAYFYDMAARLGERGYLRLYFLEIDGVRVASCLCFEYSGELLLYNSGFDPAYSAQSVGLLLKAFCIRDAIEQGKRCFDFLRGDESYKYDLGGQDLAIYQGVVSLGERVGATPSSSGRRDAPA